MKIFVCFAVFFVVGLFACQQVKAQSIEGDSVIIEQSTLVTSIAGCQQGCDCRTPVRNAVKNTLQRVRCVGCRTMTAVRNGACVTRKMVRNTACRVRCRTKRVLANTRRFTQRVFRGGCCN